MLVRWTQDGVDLLWTQDGVGLLVGVCFHGLLGEGQEVLAVPGRPVLTEPSPVAMLWAANRFVVPCRAWSAVCFSLAVKVIGSTGWAWSGVWICVFSSFERTTAPPGGARYGPIRESVIVRFGD